MAEVQEDLTLLSNAEGEHFLLGQANVYQSALAVAKKLLDPIARRNCDLTQLSVDGFDVNQIYEQAKLISESAVGKLMSVTEELQDQYGVDDRDGTSAEDLSADLLDDSDPSEAYSISAIDDASDIDEQTEVVLDENEEESSSHEYSKHKEMNGTMQPVTFKKDVHGLNDGFFDIDDFNRQTEMMEHMSDGDGDEFDYYDNDPDEQAADVQEDAGALMYNDFFGPPQVQKKKPTKMRGLARDDEYGLEAAMGAMKKDLFDQTSDPEEEVSKESRHTKQRRELAEEIRQLEEANIAKKQWTLMGEARAADRPMNSLLDEDLDFERARKPVPVVTQETIDSLEDMIKQRIRDGNFDSLKKKRAEDVVEFQPKQALSANKSDKSLAQIYEESHLAKTDPNYVNANDAKRDQEYSEIVDLVANVNKKLDALSNWHFTPKPPKASIRITTNVPAISMEDAQPTGVSKATLVAPQEVHKVQQQEGEVIRGGLPVSKEEMNRDEKRRQRRREKHARHKAAEERERTQPANKKAVERENVRDALKLGNVTVIGKKGEKRNIDGKLVTEKPGRPKRASFYKM